jgi:Forkhead domain
MSSQPSQSKTSPQESTVITSYLEIQTNNANFEASDDTFPPNPRVRSKAQFNSEGVVRPQISYVDLIIEAIQRKMYLKQYLMRRCCLWLKSTKASNDDIRTTGPQRSYICLTQGWKNSVRHNLSIKNLFTRKERPSEANGRGGVWCLVDSEVLKESGKYCLLQRLEAKRMGINIGSIHSSPPPSEKKKRHKVEHILNPSDSSCTIANNEKVIDIASIAAPVAKLDGSLSLEATEKILDNWVLKLPPPRIMYT